MIELLNKQPINFNQIKIIKQLKKKYTKLSMGKNAIITCLIILNILDYLKIVFQFKNYFI